MPKKKLSLNTLKVNSFTTENSIGGAEVKTQTSGCASDFVRCTYTHDKWCPKTQEWTCHKSYPNDCASEACATHDFSC